MLFGGNSKRIKKNRDGEGEEESDEEEEEEEGGGQNFRIEGSMGRGTSKVRGPAFIVSFFLSLFSPSPITA